MFELYKQLFKFFLTNFILFEGIQADMLSHTFIAFQYFSFFIALTQEAKRKGILCYL